METTTTTLTNTYTLIANSGDYGAIQNIGPGTAIVFIGTSLPANSERGFYLKSGDILTDSFGDGNVYARLANTEPTVLVYTS